jgi:predicted TIM-barrel fold metal-dependent hydrolase
MPFQGAGELAVEPRNVGKGRAGSSGVIDCHLHVIDPARFPITPGIGYTPRPDEVGSPGELAATLDDAGVHGVVIVQPSCYGFDNAALLGAMAARPGRYKGIAVIRGDEPDVELERLAACGVVGVRFNLASFDGTALSGTNGSRLLARIKAMDWFAQVHARDDQWAAAAALLGSSGVKLIVDHFGIAQPIGHADAPGFRAVLGLGGTGRAVLKLSAPFRIVAHPDHDDALAQHVALLLGAFDREMRIWGSDWPFLASDRRPRYADCLGVLKRWLPDAADRDRVLWHNPVRLFGF